ncbi:PAS domain S-box protein [Trichloromonas sp.]|uniref:PAS domain S-box protein n=1 Tax=Trichloromonas sp. TaxID=3069249 RepID=UPI003D813096
MDCYTFADIVDLSAVESLLESHHATSGMMVTILDPGGSELLMVGWQDLCLKYHRRHPETARLCRASDRAIHDVLASGTLAEEGYHEYRCQNGLMSIAVPILIEGQHLATLFTGQFLYEPPDEELFRAQARRFGFDEAAYLADLGKVPIFSFAQVKACMTFLTRFVMLLTRMGVDRLHRLEGRKLLAESNEKFRSLFESSNDGIFLLRPDGAILEVNPVAASRLGYRREELLAMRVADLLSPAQLREFPRRMVEVRKKQGLVYESEHVHKDGSISPVEISVRPLDYQGEPAFLATVRDISERRERERELCYREAFEALIADISSRFVALPATEADRGIDYVIDKLGAFAGVERIAFFVCDAEKQQARCTHEWYSEGIPRNIGQMRQVPLAQIPWVSEMVFSRQSIHIPRVARMPEEASLEQAFWQRLGVRSILLIPIVAAGNVVASLSLSTLSTEKIWQDNDLSMLRTIGEIVGNALERKLAADALLESEERFRSFFEHAAAGVGIVSPEGVLLAVNAAHARMFGCTVDEMCGLKMIDLTHPDDRERTLQLYRELDARKRDVIVYEKRYLRKDGSIVSGYTSVTPIYDSTGQLLYYLGLLQDITERKHAESSLLVALADAEESREKIDTILASVADGLIVTDLAHRVVLMNRQAEQLLKANWSASIGEPVETLAGHPLLLQQIEAVLAGDVDAAAVDLELAAELPENSQVLQVRTTAVMTRRGEKTGVISILRDVTRERGLDRMKNEFISTAAHELRTPLTTVLGFSQVLLNAAEYGITDNGQQHELIEHIHNKALSLKGIIDDLLDLSRIQSGQVITINYEPGDICTLLRSIVSSYRKSASEHSFELLLPESCREFLMDRKKLTQVMENLLSNAAKFSPKGRPVRVFGEDLGEFFQVSVADQGIGMSPAQVERMFDKFYRADASDTAAQGLGLGMAIARNIIEAHGGRIWVTSELGTGTTVSFNLPTATHRHDRDAAEA